MAIGREPAGAGGVAGSECMHSTVCAAIRLRWSLQARVKAKELWELKQVEGFFDDADHYRYIKYVNQYIAAHCMSYRSMGTLCT